MKDYSSLIREARDLATIIPASPSAVPDCLRDLADALEEAQAENARLEVIVKAASSAMVWRYPPPAYNA